MSVVALSGGSPALRRAVRRHLGEEASVTELRNLDRRRVGDLDPRMLDGVEVLVHLAGEDDPGDELARRRARREITDVLGAAAAAGVPHLVTTSSALVYGAWANNAVPLHESSPLRPNPGFVHAVDAAELERVVGDWTGLTGGRACVLRASPVVAETDSTWVGRALQASVAVRLAAFDPPAQFLHRDDLAGAVAVAVRERLTGAYNVAPDGWIDGVELRDLWGARPSLRLPDPLGGWWAAWRARRARRPVPAELLPYTMHPCVVANDRLRSAGWTPTLTNEEAFVASDDPPPWASMNAHQRQVVSLTVMGVVLAGLAGLVAWLAVRTRRLSAAAR